MELPPGLLEALQPWADLHANHLVVSVGLTFLHLAGLVVGGGAAIGADWRAIRAATEEARREAAAQMHVHHPTIRTALAVVLMSGIGMAAADLEVYAASTVFLVKMTLVAVLVANGLLLQRAAARAARDPQHGARLAATSAVSLVVWLGLVLAGAVLEVSA